MAKVIVEDIPDDLYHQIEKRAERHNRSLSGEIIACVEVAIAEGEPASADTIIEAAHALREEFRGELTQDLLTSLKREGRA